MSNKLFSDALPLIFNCGAELGAIQALIKTGQLRPYLKKADAFRRFGRKNVEHWIEQGLVTIRKDGDYSAAWRIDRLEIEAVAKASFLIKYI